MKAPGGAGTHLDVVAVHVVRGVSEEAVHDEALRVDAVDQGKGRLQGHRRRDRMKRPDGGGAPGSGTAWVGTRDARPQTGAAPLPAGEGAGLKHQRHSGEASLVPVAQ